MPEGHGPPVGARFNNFFPIWQMSTPDFWALKIIYSDYSLGFIFLPAIQIHCKLKSSNSSVLDEFLEKEA